MEDQRATFSSYFATLGREREQKILCKLEKEKKKRNYLMRMAKNCNSVKLFLKFLFFVERDGNLFRRCQSPVIYTRSRRKKKKKKRKERCSCNLVNKYQSPIVAIFIRSQLHFPSCAPRKVATCRGNARGGVTV